MNDIALKFAPPVPRRSSSLRSSTARRRLVRPRPVPRPVIRPWSPPTRPTPSTIDQIETWLMSGLFVAFAGLAVLMEAIGFTAGLAS
ncbi:MAG TPA: hypothetical protein VGV37_16945 [Aliidongia sp.]|uniref:hypothetical protein n=1 Tax=Aliidongia sp. TaxID=1914230 RepID=UPI002DDD298F|nr:hypothetical protein [Aliidongia sp.]HEV2676215.1 hypothetical protein [Aliidongia sp.]